MNYATPADRLAGKVALITGAARGQGSAHGRVLAAAGARVVLGDILDEDGQALAAEIGDAAIYVRLDVTSPSDWAAAVAAATDRFGRLDVLVNNAGIGFSARVEDTTLADWRRVLDVNLTGPWIGIQAALPALRQSGGGSIVNISSVDGLMGMATLHPYVASKFGLRGITKSLAAELGQHGIRVNSVHPGYVDTPMVRGIGMLPEHMFIPLGRGARPDEISQLVLYLASDEAGFVTGAEFVIDGGQTAHLPLTEAFANRAQADKAA
ncbi:glucose 1-dehydrogenase [Croceibacterium ferulae]|uniref:glucose 1-dehydrogenase n=1 Tax=Croceibacterium ferulae TaxID=1854641 RepID=UPI000EAB7735|nr:glucose 1-dehydrogenase [Croceibacterium ferulae]